MYSNNYSLTAGKRGAPSLPTDGSYAALDASVHHQPLQVSSHRSRYLLRYYL